MKSKSVIRNNNKDFLNYVLHDESIYRIMSGYLFCFVFLEN